MITWDDEHVHAIFTEEFNKQAEMMKAEGSVKATVFNQDGHLGVKMCVQFGGMSPEVCSSPSITEEEATDDKIREMISGGLRVIREMHEQKAAGQ